MRCGGFTCKKHVGIDLFVSVCVLGVVIAHEKCKCPWQSWTVVFQCAHGDDVRRHYSDDSDCYCCQSRGSML